MVTTDFTITVIGAGVVGLACAEVLSAQYSGVLVLEKNPSFGQETSSRHSGVIHAGIYYPTGLLKAESCRDGNRRLYEVCGERDIPHERIGKLIVAVTDDEEEDLFTLKDRAERNGVNDLALLSERQVRSLEPYVSARAGLFSPSTGIIDAHSLMRSFYITAVSNDTLIVFNSAVTDIHYDGHAYDVEINGGDYRFRTAILINSAGLHADGIAALAGIDVEKEGYRLKYCKGNYFYASPAPPLKHLVYPVPQLRNEGLGIHATLDLGGRVKFGPDTEYIDDLDYRVNEKRKESFFRSIVTYLPSVTIDSLHADTCGIRPKLQGPGDPYRDFVIKEERDGGFPGLINLIGIESPGLTSCISIAHRVASLVERCREGG
ncbi:MAG: NAD(P)/FAD-dependent oxidoreductase [Deltaproteobacteria bacterium]|nr:NAD(P)/FAD-dependent oxidoreductase [Deltaproteobacteria bacterium]